MDNKTQMQASKLTRVILIVLALIFFVLLVLYFTESNKGMREVTLSNLTSNSATISWVTDDSLKASVQFSKNNTWPILIDRLFTKDMAYDDRNTKEEGASYVYSSEIASDRKIHHVTVRNLDPETTYYFRINGNFKTFSADLNSFTTLKLDDTLVEPDPVYGKVKNYVVDEPEPVDGIIFYRVIDPTDASKKSMLYSSTISPESSWSGDLSGVRASDGSRFVWTVDGNSLEVEGKTDLGYGWKTYTLFEYKPVEELFVNVRYAPPEV